MLSLGDLVGPHRRPQALPSQHGQIQRKSVGDTNERIVVASCVSGLVARLTAQTSLNCHGLPGPNIVAIIDSTHPNLKYFSRCSTRALDHTPEEMVADSSWAGHRLTSWANSGSNSFCLSIEPDWLTTSLSAIRRQVRVYRIFGGDVFSSREMGDCSNSCDNSELSDNITASSTSPVRG